MALLFINCSVSNAQESVTNNLVTNTQQSWSGCYTATPVPTFGGLSGGPCPGVSDNYVIFSWGQYTLSQSIAINQALANAGSGLQVTGYNYGWSVKNSNINGQQPGSYDPIAYIDVNLYNSAGSLLVNDRYNYGYHLPNWTYFSGTRTYTNPYDAANLGNIQLAVTGKDSGFWAGYYGAEFSNFSLSLNYSVKPQQITQTSTPTVSGTASLDPTKLDATLTDVGGVEMSTTGGLQTPDNLPQVAKDGKKTNSTSVGLSIVSRNRERERTIINQQQNAITESNEQLALSFTRAGSILGVESTGLTSPTNPINSALQSNNRPVESQRQESNTSTVKKNVPNNELAGGVDINRMAQLPAGFDLYSMSLEDRPFYPTREIYRGQRNVDNARAERFLNSKSDVLHQMMIEQQYNLGN